MQISIDVVVAIGIPCVLAYMAWLTASLAKKDERINKLEVKVEGHSVKEASIQVELTEAKESHEKLRDRFDNLKEIIIEKGK